MKKFIMQKMSSFYKNLKLLIMCLIISMAMFGCVSNNQEQKDGPSKQEQNIDNSQNKNNTNENLEYAEGLVPPTNQNIMLAYYVQDGDNLAIIAKKIYGDKKEWIKLAELNNLIDPHKIYAGDVIYYSLTNKTKTFSETYEGAPRAKIIVKKGDTLTHISKAVFGKAKDWRVLWKENPQITNPDKLKVGEVIYFRPKALTADASSFSSSIIETRNDNIIQPAAPIKQNEDEGTKESKAEM
ncbi:LysM peptidoglycan-binding domain-containing protein [Fluviispira multicolorata]|uniref:LysM peptidoglycan-binding domain-containing protein n=1 Tax=Fluviispira multicolorata TaxID=2654512 RepID=A0A833JCQ3_9BACT|nr:LysM domain-containing protein [Fluviispira multicolorata]KAB8030866.1 LysM peptidoglycan-binding domain-containing protein [Fluviispira multicolorata]